MRFQWRLQSVLDVREKQEQLKRAELAELTVQRDRTEAELIRCRQALSELMADLANEQPKTRLEKQPFVMARASADDAVIKQLETNLALLGQQCEEKRAEVIELKKLVEGLSKLRDKAEQEFIAEQNKQLQAAADEITTYRFANLKDQRSRIKVQN